MAGTPRQRQGYDSYETLSFPSKSTKVRDVIIPEKDYQRLLYEATDPDFALYLRALWETGCRPNEITSLKKTDIDFAKGFARIFQNKTQKYKIVYFTDELLALFQQAPLRFASGIKAPQDDIFLGAQRYFHNRKALYKPQSRRDKG